MRSRLASLAAVTLVAVAAGIGVPAVAHADEVRDGQWYLKDFDIAKVHELSQGAGVTIGVIDSGVDANHPDLAGNVEAGLDMTQDDGDGRTDKYGHGTAVASVIAGHGHGESNAEGVIGIAPRATILPVRKYVDVDTEASGADGTAEAIRWLAENGADIISISLGYEVNPADSSGAIKYANDKGIPVIASSGNFEQGTDDWGVEYTMDRIGWPARAKGMIPVGGTGQNGEVWEHSISLDGAAVQPQLGLSAPAVDIPIALPDGKYDTKNGTSFSAPIVAGTLALIKSAYPNLDYFQLVDRLLDTVDDQGPEGFDNEYGWGTVNPLRALTEETTLEGNDGAKVSRPDDRLPLEEQGKTDSNPGDESSGDANSMTGTVSGNLTWLILSIAAIILAVVAVTIALILRRRNKSTTPPLANPAGMSSPKSPQ